MAFIDCCYSKVFFYKFTKDLRTNRQPLTYEQKYGRQVEYNNFFGNYPNMQLADKHFADSKAVGKVHQYVKNLMSTFSKTPIAWKCDQALFMAAFADTKWEELHQFTKYVHSLHECNGCKVYHRELYMGFPSKQINFPAKRPLHPVVALVNDVQQNLQEMNIIERKGDINTAATEVYAAVNDKFQAFTGVSFGSVLPQVTDAHVELRRSKYEKECVRKQHQVQVKQRIEEVYKKVDAERPYTQRESLAHYHKATRGEMLTERTTPSKLHRHSAINITFDVDGAIGELEELEIGTAVNWNDLARRHGITAANSGQVLKEHLQERDIDTAKWNNKLKRNVNVDYERRVKRKLCNKVNFPSHLTTKDIREVKQQNIDNGTFLLGQKIDCGQTTFLEFSATNTVVTSQRTAQGRHISFLDIRKKTIEQHYNLLRVFPDEYYDTMTEDILENELLRIDEPLMPLEDGIKYLKRVHRTRHWKVWHDHSSIDNGGHMLLEVSGVYDPALYLKQEEYKSVNGKGIDVVTLVEAPFICILAPLSDSTAAQNLLIESRINDMLSLSETVSTKDGIEIFDKVRFHHGDNPALQYEAGVSRGGDYPCTACGLASGDFSNFIASFTVPFRSYSDILGIASAGYYSGLANTTLPIYKMKKFELLKECTTRHIHHTKTTTAVVLKEKLKNVCKGVETVPALLRTDPKRSLESLNLQDIDIVPAESLHTVKGHIMNLFEEMKHYKDTNIRDLIREFYVIHFGKLNTIRGRDARESLEKVVRFLRSHDVDNDVIILFESLSCISYLLYLESSKRSRRSILKLYNQTYVHCSLIHKLIQKPRESKFFGKYIHDLIVHSPQVARIVSPRSVNAELQEKEFKTLKGICRVTGNHNSEQSIDNMIIRVQAEANGRSGPYVKSSGTLPSFITEDTIIPIAMIMRDERLWQCHLERIADFLQPGKDVWWNWGQRDIHFYDNISEIDHSPIPALRHFRQCSLKAALNEVSMIWRVLLESHIHIPALKIWIFERNILKNIVYFNKAGKQFMDEE